MILKDLENRIKFVDTVWLIRENKPRTRIVIIRRDDDGYSSLGSYMKRPVTSYERNGSVLKIRIR